MAIDVARIIQAAIEAAMQEPTSDTEAKPRKPHLSGGRALLLGAGLLTVGRLAAPKGREMLGSLQQRLEEYASGPEDEERDDEEDYDYDEEPEGEGDEDFEEEDDYDEEPEGEGDEDFDEEDDYDEGEDEDERPRPRRRTRSRARSRS